jgi:hypothetical protein
MTTDELSRMFAAERAARPPAQALENGLPRFLSDVAGQVAPLPIATGALKVGWSVASKWIAIGFVVGLGGAGAAATWGPSGVATSTPTPPATVSGQLVAATVATGDWGTEIGLDEARPEQPPAAASAGGSTLALPVSPARIAKPTGAADATTFDAELRLIAAAKRELDQGRPQLATGWLDEHAQRFPSGVFALDREALRILSVCRQDKNPALAQAFATRHPGSPMRERLLRACGAAPASERSGGSSNELGAAE